MGSLEPSKYKCPRKQVLDRLRHIKTENGSKGLFRAHARPADGTVYQGFPSGGGRGHVKLLSCRLDDGAGKFTFLHFLPGISVAILDFFGLWCVFVPESLNRSSGLLIR